MLLEGKAVTVAALGGAALAMTVWEALGPVAQHLLAAAALIAALKVIGGSLRASLRRGREVHEAVTSDLPDRMTGVEGELVEVKAQLEVGQERFREIERVLEVHGEREAAAVHGALTAADHARAPRRSRSTDPTQRTGWRE